MEKPQPHLQVTLTASASAVLGRAEAVDSKPEEDQE